MSTSKIIPIAIHLPQFHPIPENNAWWGKGFTEWTNVTKAKPLFKSHYQPHLPADLGYYDLRLPEAREAQAALAKQYGIEGFCFYHYWFKGKRLLNRPVDEMLKSKNPDFPFMLCWANENWSRRWDGNENAILIKQEYSDYDDLEHIRFLCNEVFPDNRYIKKDNKPFFLIYRPALFPNIERTIETWRNEAVKCGIGELYLGYVQNFSYKINPDNIGFDCAIQFQPDFDSLPFVKEGKNLVEFLRLNKISKNVLKSNIIVSYKDYVSYTMSKGKPAHNLFPGITPGWDNSPRKKTNAVIFVDSCPEDFENWLLHIKNLYKNQETFLFVNAWNEWAEGNHMEPCQKWGRRYLEVTKKVVAGNKN